MKLVLEDSGEKFDVYSVDLSDDPLLPDNAMREFLDSLPQGTKTRPSGPKGTFTHLFLEHKDHGPIHNDRKSRHLGDGVYEFKADQGPGWRLYYFNSGKRTIVTHGSQKRNRRLSQEIERVKAIRQSVKDNGL